MGSWRVFGELESWRVERLSGDAETLPGENGRRGTRFLDLTKKMVTLLLCVILVTSFFHVDGRTTIGYIEARTQGDVHLLSSFRPTGSVVSVDTEILTSKSDWKISILNGDELVKNHIRLEDCKCDCIGEFKLKEAEVRPVNGEWRIENTIENAPGLLAVVLASCDVKRIHSGDKLIEYAVTYINHDGTHVSKEEVGERALIGSFFVVYELGSVCFFYAWFKYYKTHGSFEKERQYLLYLYTASIWMYSMDLACKYVHLSTYEEDGKGQPTLLYISMIFRTTSQSLFVLLLLFVPRVYAKLSGLQKTKKQTTTKDEAYVWRFVNSYLVSNEEEPEYKRSLHLFLFSYCVTYLWASYEIGEQQYHQSRNSETLELISIFVCFIFEIAVYLLFAFRSLDVSNRAEEDQGVRNFFRSFIWIFTPLFVASLVRLLLCAFDEPWSSAVHYANSFGVFMFVLSFVFMGKILWPSSLNWILTDAADTCHDRKNRDFNVPFGRIGENLSKLIWDDGFSSRKVYSKVDEYDDVDDSDAYDEIPGGVMAKLESF